MRPFDLFIFIRELRVEAAFSSFMITIMQLT